MSPEIDNNTVIQEFYESEIFKENIGLKKQKFPKACHMINTWEKKTLIPEEIAQLDIYVNTKISDGIPDGTLNIFRALNTTNVGEIAKNLEFLKSLRDPIVNIWLDQISPRMRYMIYSDRCPPLILMRPTLYNYGNMPDGNHRAIAALDLVAKGEKGIKLTAYVGQLNGIKCLLWNTGMFLFNSNIPVKERSKIVQCRLRNTWDKD